MSQPSVISSGRIRQDWSQAVSTNKGGYMRLEDYCNSFGNGLMYTSGMMLMEEELLVLELGERVVNYIMEKEIDYWDALMDLFYAETIKNGG